MKFRRLTWLVAFVAGLGVLAAPGGDVPEAAAKSGHRAGKTKVCTTRKGKRRCRWRKSFDGHNVAESRLREEPLDKPSGDIEVIPRHFAGESYKVNIYDADGNFDEAALAELDHAFRCRRTDNERAVDPRLYEVLSHIYDHFGGRPIVLVSGHRYQRDVASRHYHAAAMDIHIEGVSDRKLYEYAESLDAGGMGVGIYPRSGFVHVDIRAPGAKSYRWTDWSGPGSSGGSKKKHKRKRPTRERKPLS